MTQYSWRERLQYVARPLGERAGSASSSIQPSISTSPVSCCWTTAGTRPSADALEPGGDGGVEAPRAGQRGHAQPLSACPAGPPTTRAARRRRRRLGRPARRAGRAGRPGPVDDDHLVGVLGGGEPVGDGDRGAAAHQPLQGPADPHLQGRVDRAGGLVEHQQVGVGEVGPQQRDQLPLPRRQRLAALARPGWRARAGSPASQSPRPSSSARGADRRPRWRRAGRSARWPRGCRRTGSPPAAPARRRGAATSPAISRTSTPSRRTAPSAGSISRVSSLAKVDLPEPVSPTMATRVPAAISRVDVAQHRRAVGVGEGDVARTARRSGRAAAPRRPGPGRPGRRGSPGCRSPGASRRWRSGRR